MYSMGLKKKILFEGHCSITMHTNVLMLLDVKKNRDVDKMTRVVEMIIVQLLLCYIKDFQESARYNYSSLLPYILV